MNWYIYICSKHASTRKRRDRPIKIYTDRVRLTSWVDMVNVHQSHCVFHLKMQAYFCDEYLISYNRIEQMCDFES